MGLIRQFEGQGITVTATSPDVEIGSRRMYQHPTYGWQEWVYVQNGNASSLTAGLGVMQKSSAVTNIGDLSGAATPNCRMLGVAQHTIAAASYGWILRNGLGLTQSNGTQTVNTAQKTAASGQFTDGTIGSDEMCVFAIGDDGGVASTNVVSRVAVP
jgi:hypothetical protein